jgi:hypothetical protein
MSDPPTGPEAQIRQLYFELKAIGYPADLARTGCAVTLLANGISALAKALGQLAADRYGDDVPPETALMIGHADTAAGVATRIALGSLDLESLDDE